MSSPVCRPQLWLLCCALGCSSAGGSTTESTTESTTTESTGDPSTTDTAGTDACQASSECEDGEICVAPYNLDPEPGPGGARGPATCVPEQSCIATPDDIHSWCFDHQGCCGDLRCRSADGVCEEQLVDTTTSGTTSDATSDSESDSMTDTDSETDTDSATDTDTDTETGTDTDAGTDTDTDTDTTG